MLRGCVSWRAAVPLALLQRVAVDITPVRASRDLRLLLGGELVTGMGTQAALVALPYQLYVETGSAFLTGLLGAVELLPLVTMALLGGALADRSDRRRVLLLDQVALVAVSGTLAAVTFAPGDPPLPLLFVLAGLLAGFGAVQNVTRSAIIPNLVTTEKLRSTLALSFGLYQVTLVLGPGLGGLLIGALGVGAAYTVDAVSCFAMVWAALAMRPQPPQGDGAPLDGVLRSIAEGLRFVGRNRALTGSFAIDLMAMTFGMPARPLRRARGERLPRGRRRYRPALRRRLGRGDGGRADDGLARPRAPARPDRGVGGLRL